MSKNPKNWGKLMKIVNIDRDFLHIFRMTWQNSMKFSGKMCFEIILKVTKNQGFTLSLEDTFFEKPQGALIWPPPPPHHSPTPRVKFYICQGRGGFVELGHFDKHFIKKSRKKAPHGNILEFFLLDILKTTFLIANLT